MVIHLKKLLSRIQTNSQSHDALDSFSQNCTNLEQDSYSFRLILVLFAALLFNNKLIIGTKFILLVVDLSNIIFYKV